MLLKVAIIDERESYRERLAEVFAADYADRLDVSTYSSMESCDEHLSGTSFDIMLVSATFGNDKLEGRQGATLAYLVDDKSIERLYSRPAICRFQKVDLIYRDIVSASVERFDNASIRQESIEGTAILSFFPASGGTGASSMAAACALGAAKRGLRVFYLNLELYGRTDMYFTADGVGNLGDVFFAIEAKRSNIAQRIQGLTRRNADGVYFLAPCETPTDLIEFQSSNVEQLIRNVVASDDYDLVVLDLDYATGGFAPTALSLSDRVVFVSNGTYISNDKFERIYSVLNASKNAADASSGADNVILAYNNFDKTTGVRLTNDMIAMAGTLYHLETRSTLELVDELSNNVFFDNLLSFALEGLGQA